MENTNVQEVKMPITYDDLKKSLVDSGRPYDFAMIDRAYALAEKAHGEQRRRSGEPYICHPLSVAQILVELGMDSESIAAALMHDVAEDTPVTVAEIKQKFGPEVALLVDGVTKLTQIKFSNVEDRQAENLRKMLLAMSQDVRVMIIKLCDRLHNMRTGDAWPEQKRRDKALETMEVYAPIAHRLGISNIKEELEDRSLHYLDPVGYETIRDLLNKHGDEFLHQVCHTIARHLSENGIQKATIRHRVKSIYGIYRKMYMQNKDFEEIYDIYAVRIILDNVPECYTALGLIHDMYHPLPNRFKDYISTPKPNGYQSLHTTVIGREDPHLGHGPHGGVRHRRALEVQGRHHGQQRQAGRAPGLGAPAAGKPALQRRRHGFAQRHQERPAARGSVRLHAARRRHQPARGRDGHRLRLRDPLCCRQQNDRCEGQ